MARPTKYRPEYVEQARFLCEQFGATDEQLAKALGVTDGTIYNWKSEHPEFLEAIGEAKCKFDTRNVQSSVLACAQGYFYQEEMYDGDRGQIVRLWKYRHPDIKAQALWLANRQGWRLPMPAGGRGGVVAELPSAAGNAQPPGGADEDTAALDAAAQERLNNLAVEILEARHATRIVRHVESQEIVAADTAEKGQL